MKKRILSFALVLCMVLTLLPVSAFADYYGTCGNNGDNVNWKYSNGTLTISGTGEMCNYGASYDELAPWLHENNSYSNPYSTKYVKTVIISDGVTNVGEEAFRMLPNLSSVSIADSVITIGTAAFYGCSNITNLYLSKNLKSIGEAAFCSCTKLENITIPNGVTSIGVTAFCDCSGLTSVTIPNSVTSIGCSAFRFCTGLDSITIPNSVTSIEDYTFSECTGLTSVMIPGSVTSIGDSAFNKCTSLTDVYYCGTQEQWNNIIIESNNDNLKNATLHYHDYCAGEATEPTCTEKGYAIYTCSICGDSYKDSCADALGHDYGEWIVTSAPTCTENGLETRYCSRCDAYETREVAALDHNCVHHDAKAPTCTEIGWEAYDTCTRCSYTTYCEIPATGHSYTSVVTAPTCVDKGYTTYTCACGDSYVSDYVDALGHNYGEWVVTCAPTCTANGSMIRYCSRCDVYEIKTIPALGHNYVEGECARCGESCNPFVDVSESAVYYDAILWAYYHTPKQITSGTDATHFSPAANCTRGQVVTFLWRAAGCPEPTDDCPFVDVSSTSPYYKAIIWAAEQGITNGMDATHFAPNATVTRAQFVTFLWRYEGQPEAEGTIDNFKDASSIATPFKEAVAWAVGEEIAGGYSDGTFRPNATCTRWAVVLFMYRDLK